MVLEGIEYIDCKQTTIGLICLRERKHPSEPDVIITELMIDHALLMSSHNTASERALASLALEMHTGEDLRVLVGGFGLGYTAKEVLKSLRVRSVENIEFVPQVIEWMKKGMIPLSAELMAEPRLAVVHGNIYARLDAPPEGDLHDLILIDVDHSPDERLAEDNVAFYTEEGLRRAKQHLAPGGVLAVWSYAEHSPFASAMQGAFEEVRVEPVTFENVMMQEQETNWLFFGRG